MQHTNVLVKKALKCMCYVLFCCLDVYFSKIDRIIPLYSKFLGLFLWVFVRLYHSNKVRLCKKHEQADFTDFKKQTLKVSQTQLWPTAPFLCNEELLPTFRACQLSVVLANQDVPLAHLQLCLIVSLLAFLASLDFSVMMSVFSDPGSYFGKFNHTHW